MSKLKFGRTEIKIMLDDAVTKLIQNDIIESAYSDVELREDGFIYKVSFEKPFDNSWLATEV